MDVLPLWMNKATFLKSSSTKPLEVRAGEPNLSPLGRRALLSPERIQEKVFKKVHSLRAQLLRELAK